jgi:DNA recombination protein RmuC
VLEQARDALKDSFAAISADLLAQNNTRFLALAKEKLGEFQQGAVTDLDVRQKAIADLVQPLRDR